MATHVDLLVEALVALGALEARRLATVQLDMVAQAGLSVVGLAARRADERWAWRHGWNTTPHTPYSKDK